MQGKRLRRGSRDRVSDDLDIFVKFIHIFVVFGAGKIAAEASGAAERAIFYRNIFTRLPLCKLLAGFCADRRGGRRRNVNLNGFLQGSIGRLSAGENGTVFHRHVLARNDGNPMGLLIYRNGAAVKRNIAGVGETKSHIGTVSDGFPCAADHRHISKRFEIRLINLV